MEVREAILRSIVQMLSELNFTAQNFFYLVFQSKIALKSRREFL